MTHKEPIIKPIDWAPALGVIPFERRNPGYSTLQGPIEKKSRRTLVYEGYQFVSCTLFMAGLIKAPYLIRALV